MIDPEQAAVVIRIFEMYANGMGLRGIAVQLNEEGVPGPKGVWSRYTIREMVRNERVIAGCRSGGGPRRAGTLIESGRKVSRAAARIELAAGGCPRNGALSPNGCGNRCNHGGNGRKRISTSRGA